MFITLFPAPYFSRLSFKSCRQLVDDSGRIFTRQKTEAKLTLWAAGPNEAFHGSQHVATESAQDRQQLRWQRR